MELSRKLLLTVAMIIATVASGAEVKLPKPVGKKGADLLLFCGGRPWIANNCRQFFATSGFKVTLVGPDILNGLGGAPLRKFLHESPDKEPPKKDGITPAFKQLDRFKVVFFNAIPLKNQRKIFTVERIEALKKFVADGGGLVIDRDAPFELLDGLSPVVANGDKFMKVDGAAVKRVVSNRYAFLPEKWDVLTPYAPVKIAENAEVIALINGEVPYIAAKNYGKGRVLFFNDYWKMNGDAFRQFFYWGYSKALMAELAADAAKMKEHHPAELVLNMPDRPARKNLKKISLKVSAPVLKIEKLNTPPVIRKNHVRFADGVKINVMKNGRLNIFVPGMDKAVIRSAQIPVPEIYGDTESFDSDSTEADGDTRRGKTIRTDWKYTGIEPRDNGGAAICYTDGKGATLEWIFHSGKMNINGRKYTGFTDHVEIKNFKGTIESVKFSGKLLADFTNLKTRRMACYTSIRGYDHYDMSGKKSVRLPKWNFFGSGQPFTYMNADEGIFAEFPDKAMPLYAQMNIRKNTKNVTRELFLSVGRKRNNLKTGKIWHIYSAGAEDIENDYMAIWQTVRRHLRKQEKVKSFPILSRASWGTGRHPLEHRLKVMKAAAKLGFSTMRLPYSPCAMEKLDDENHMLDYKNIRALGMIPRPWSPGGYLHGQTEQIFKDHPEWFIRKANGKIYGYFNDNYPVADFNNPEFRKWYYALIRRCKAGGMGAIYMDMIGAAAQLVNYAGKEAEPVLNGVVEVFRFLSAEDLSFGIEGMNPLAIDNYWYRRFRYIPMSGREFAVIGSSLVLKPEDGDTFSLDPFRMAMYNANGRIDLDGYVENIERFPNEIKMIEKLGTMLPEIDRTFKRFRLPFIKTTEFGTLWTEGDKGALFFYDSVDSITLELPPGWGIEGVKGKTIKNIKPETIINIGREYSAK